MRRFLRRLMCSQGFHGWVFAYRFNAHVYVYKCRHCGARNLTTRVLALALALGLAGCASVADNYRAIKAAEANEQFASDAELCRGYGFRTPEDIGRCVIEMENRRQRQKDRISDGLSRSLFR